MTEPTPSAVTTCSRVLEFDYGHRVLGHGGKCAHLHGHRGRAVVTCRAPLDGLGMVVDFSLIKELVGAWIDNHWDHNLLLNRNDPMAASWHTLQSGLGTWGMLAPTHIGRVFTRPPYILEEGNPTAEVMARVLFDVSRTLLAPHRIEVIRVDLYETPNCWATYEGEPCSS